MGKTMKLKKTIGTISILISVFLLCIGCGRGIKKDSVSDSSAGNVVRGFYKTLDQAVKAAGAQNTTNYRVVGFENLRTNAFLAAVKDRLNTDDKKAQWLKECRNLDMEDRLIEIQNLPESSITDPAFQVYGVTSRKHLIEMLHENADKLSRINQAGAGYFESVCASIEIPDKYSTTMRVLGLYPIAALPVAYFTHKGYDKIRRWYDTPDSRLPVKGRLTVYAPDRAEAFSRDRVQSILARTKNSFGMHQLSQQDRQFLIRVYAPLIIPDIADIYDKIGTPVWKSGHIRIDTQNPAVYYYFTHAFYEKTPVLQINYTFWFTERDGEYSPWIERGPIDGLTVRVSLKPSGMPFMIDFMNNCGCYHTFLPRKSDVRSTRPRKMAVDALVPSWMPEAVPFRRFGLQLNSGWHQVQHVDTFDIPGNAMHYRLLPYEKLETLVRESGSHRSMFKENGISYDSPRIEHYIFFSMGIPEVGSMRRRGNHPTKLVGREFFDDPHIYNNNFVLSPLESMSR